jgi:RNA-directed DNA polymerase
MKRAGNLFEAIADWANLRLAAAKALRAKRARADARAYVARLDDHLRRLRAELLAGSVTLGRSHQFVIHDPKERLITAPCFEERLLHHAILNVCEPVFDRWLIFDTYACRAGKGRVACLQRAQEFARRFPFFLKLDIRRYFDSIDHATLKLLLARRFKDRALLALLGRIIDSYAVAPGKGLPIGSLTSQHFANFYLGWCDRFIKEKRRLPGYVRYMDDMIAWADTAAPLQAALPAIESWLAEELQLGVKAKPYRNRSAHGVDILGCRVFPTHQVLNRASQRRFRRKIGALDAALRHGEISEREAQARGQALVAFTQTAGVKSWRFRRRIIDHDQEDGPGLGAGAPRRQLDQQRQELPLRLPQQERAARAEPEHRLPSGRSSNGDQSPAGTGRRPVPP